MKILILEANLFVRQALVTKLASRHLVQATYSPHQAMAWFNQEVFDYCLVNLFLNHHSGLEFIYEANTWPDLRALRFIMISVDPTYLRQARWGLTELNVQAILHPMDINRRLLRLLR